MTYILFSTWWYKFWTMFFPFLTAACFNLFVRYTQRRNLLRLLKMKELNPSIQMAQLLPEKCYAEIKKLWILWVITGKCYLWYVGNRPKGNPKLREQATYIVLYLHWWRHRNLHRTVSINGRTRYNISCDSRTNRFKRLYFARLYFTDSCLYLLIVIQASNFNQDLKQWEENLLLNSWFCFGLHLYLVINLVLTDWHDT